VLAGLLDLALPVLNVPASAMLFAGLAADEVHLRAVAVADDAAAVEASDREDPAITHQLLSLRQPLREFPNLVRVDHWDRSFLNQPTERCLTILYNR
jgi:hypothetical protein